MLATSLCCPLNILSSACLLTIRAIRISPAVLRNPCTPALLTARPITPRSAILCIAPYGANMEPGVVPAACALRLPTGYLRDLTILNYGTFVFS